jgi:hypothetical protein
LLEGVVTDSERLAYLQTLPGYNEAMQLHNTPEFIARVNVPTNGHPSLAEIERQMADIVAKEAAENEAAAPSQNEPPQALPKGKKQEDFTKGIVLYLLDHGASEAHIRKLFLGMYPNLEGTGWTYDKLVKKAAKRFYLKREEQVRVKREVSPAELDRFLDWLKIPTTTANRQLKVTLASDIRPLPVEWLWTERIPKAMLSLIGGRESCGKSTLLYERAARITRGQLDGALRSEPRPVIVAATEDSWAHTVVPRLMAADADLTKVARVEVDIRDLGTFDLSLPDDVPELAKLVADLNAALVILDPVISRLNRKIDSHKDQEVRVALEPLARFADETGAAVVGIIHVNKGTSRDPLTTIMGSRAFVATARAVLFVAQDPDNPQTRILGLPKCNVGRDDSAGLPTLKFTIEAAVIETDAGPATTSRLLWKGESKKTIRDVLEQVADKGHGPRQTAEKWLRAHMKQGEAILSSKLKEEAESAGIRERTLERAADTLGVIKDRSAFPRTTWCLPEDQEEL